uniref:PKD/Chitinase domain-containing protein n=1 Tax=Panagrolaimus sp. JU765 TaxID=591449 RepID=A0AC34R6B5_9BILA
MNVKIIILYWICIYFCYGLDAPVANDESEEIPPPSVVTDSPVDFIVDGPETIQLPAEKVIFRVVFGENEIKKDMGNWSFYWVPIEGLGNSYADAYDEPILTLTKLKPGKLKFQVTVSNQIVSGHHEKSLIVYEPKKDNIKPIAMIKPPGPVKISENSQLVLDGEGSKDDDGKITTFEWHLKKGPSVQLPNDLNTPILTLNHLQPGNYTFLLKVTDNSNESNETEIDVIVTEERDDPPKARISRCGDTATGSITVRLPITALYLCGNGSTDDVGVVDYKWTRKDSLLPVDSTGSSTSILTLTNIHSNEDVGPYMFELQVGDAKGQKDTATISIFVNKAENQPPKVSAGTNVTITLPETSAVLDGTVEDDGTIVTYKWKQIDGPTQSKLVNDDKSKATAMDLHEGTYGFEFVVIDDGGLNATSKVFITVERVKNDAPKA